MLIRRSDPSESMIKNLTPTLSSRSNNFLMGLKRKKTLRIVVCAGSNLNTEEREIKYVPPPPMWKLANQRRGYILDKIMPACRHYKSLAKTSLVEEFAQAVGQDLCQVSEDNSIYVSTYCKPKGILCEPKKPNITSPNKLLDMESDRQLGRYLQEHLFHQKTRCSSCKELPSAHIKCYMHQKGDVRQTVECVLPTGEQDRNIRTWNACCKCEYVDEEVMYDTDLESPFGMFLERNLSISATANSVASCGHSRQDLDCCFGFHSMVAVFHFSPKVNLSVSLHQPQHMLRAQCMSLKMAVEKFFALHETNKVGLEILKFDLQFIYLLRLVFSNNDDINSMRITSNHTLELVCSYLQETTDESIIPIQEDKLTSIISHALTSTKYEDVNEDLDCVSGIHDAFCGAVKSSLHQKISFKSENMKFAVITKFAAEFEALRKKIGIGKFDFFCSLITSSKFLTDGGKSGAYFEKSQDGRFITKEISNNEVKFFEKNGPEYFKSIGDLTLIVKTLGIYQVKVEDLNGGKSRQMNVMVMENLNFGKDESSLRMFDLKGSVRNRYNAPAKKVLLDKNFLEEQHTNPMRLTSDANRKFDADLRKNVAFLQRIGAMDYSLIITEDLVSNEKVVGIIDYLGSYTPNKFCETWSKKIYDAVLHFDLSTWPTVIHPYAYGERFIKNILAYFPMLPQSSNAEFDNLSDATP